MNLSLATCLNSFTLTPSSPVVFFVWINLIFCIFTATGFDEDIATITAGKEFTIVKTTGGKVRI